jgi:hypothetical protein
VVEILSISDYKKKLNEEIKQFHVESSKYIKEFSDSLEDVFNLALDKHKFFNQRHTLVLKRFELMERSNDIVQNKKVKREKFLYHLKTGKLNLLYESYKSDATLSQLNPKNDFEREILFDSYLKELDELVIKIDNYIKTINDTIKTIDSIIFNIANCITLDKEYKSHFKN